VAGRARVGPLSGDLVRARTLLAAAFASALASGGLACSQGKDAQDPEGAVTLLISAARTGDRAAVYRRLGPATRARIDNLAATAQKTGGRGPMKPEDFLSVGWAPPTWEPAGMRTLRRDKTTAEVEVHSPGGDRHTVSLVLDREEWKVELPGR
jgi:hypothetical protein